jgi:O-antigen chain-terminating methyltransferase
MRRKIEDLVAQRKKQQNKLLDTLDQLGELLEGRAFRKRDRETVKNQLRELGEDISQLMTLQDREWDAYSNNHSTMVFKSLQWKIEKLEAEYANVKTLITNFITLEDSLKNLIQSISENTDKQTLEKLKSLKKQLSPYQYSDFEVRFRGDETAVKEKLARYLPYFQSHNHILDIGCGRGEFVELLVKSGKTVEGIDSSDSMLTVAQERGLSNCFKKDALSYLKDKGDQSLGGIFSAQVIEHFAPDYLREVILESRRVLKPGSPILLETINPSSLFAMAHIFPLDITHQKPLHPEFMRYLLESSGFSRVEVIFLDEIEEEKLIPVGPQHELAREFNTNVDKLNQLLYSAPTYAVHGLRT